MSLLGQHTRREILSQPGVWSATLGILDSYADALRTLYRDGQFDAVIFTGCGSPYYLALHAAAATQELGDIAARGVPASELWLAPNTQYRSSQRTLLVALSRSGTTTETIRACQVFRERGAGAIVTLSCYPDTPLTQLGDLNIVLPDAQEQSLAQTRAFTALQVGVLAAIAHWTDCDAIVSDLQRLPEAAGRLLSQYGDLAQALGSDDQFDRFYFLGSGARYGLACELALKMKEMSLSHSEPFHFLEFRHGPQTMVNETTLVVGLLSEKQRQYEQAVLHEMDKRGARVLSIASDNAEVMFGTGLHSLAASPLYLPIGQSVALEHAVAKGLDPDRPHNLEAVVILSDV